MSLTTTNGPSLKHPLYSAYTALCRDAVTKKGAKVRQPLSCTQTQQKGDHRQHQTWSYYSLAELWSHGWWKHYIVNKGNYPAKESVWQWSVDYPKFIQLYNQGFMWMEVIMTLERKIKRWLANVTKEPHNDISIPLHKHLRLWIIHTIMYVEHITIQLEFLPALTGFCLLKWLDRIFFLTEVLFFPQAWLNRIFFLVEVLFFCKANLIL